MHRSSAKLVAVLSMALATLSLLPAASAAATQTLRYTVTMRSPQRQTLDVGLALRGALPLRIDMPMVTPGVHSVVDYARSVRVLAVKGELDGHWQPLRVQRVGRTGWQIRAPSGRGRSSALIRLQINYRVKADRMSVHDSHVSSVHAHLLGAATFALVRGARRTPAIVRVIVPKGWAAASTLARAVVRFKSSSSATAPSAKAAKVGVAGSVKHYRSRDYDELADSVIELGHFSRRCKRLRGGAKLCLVLHDDRQRRLPRRWLEDFARIVAVHARWFGKLPYRRYTAFIHTRIGNPRPPRFRVHGIGLEHATGTSIVYGDEVLTRRNFWQRQRYPHSYRTLLEVLAHEHFHAWNGKRVRPAPLGRTSYTKLLPTPLLWLAEGFTQYFAERTLLATGVTTVKRYRGQICRQPIKLWRSLSAISREYAYPSRFAGARQSLVYWAGARVALMLDLSLRARRRGATLIGLMRRLAARAQRQKRGVIEVSRATLSRELRALAGHDFAAELRRWTDQPVTLDCSAALAHAGFVLRGSTARRKRQKLPFEAKAAGSVLVVTKVRRAAGADGGARLFVGDLILRIDGKPASPAALARARKRSAWFTVLRKAADRQRDARLLATLRALVRKTKAQRQRIKTLGRRLRARRRYQPSRYIVERVRIYPRRHTRVEPDPRASAGARALRKAWLTP